MRLTVAGDFLLFNLLGRPTPEGLAACVWGPLACIDPGPPSLRSSSMLRQAHPLLLACSFLHEIEDCWLHSFRDAFRYPSPWTARFVDLCIHLAEVCQDADQ